MGRRGLWEQWRHVGQLEQLEIKEAEERRGGFNSYPNFLNFSMLPHAGNTSLYSRVWKPWSSMAYPQCLSYYSCGADKALIFQISPPPSHGSGGNSGLSEWWRFPSFFQGLACGASGQGDVQYVYWAGVLGKLSSWKKRPTEVRVPLNFTDMIPNFA